MGERVIADEEHAISWQKRQQRSLTLLHHPFSKSVFLLLARLIFFVCPHFCFRCFLPSHECLLNLIDRKFPMEEFDVPLLHRVAKRPVDGCVSRNIGQEECRRVHGPHPLSQIEGAAIDHQMQQSGATTVTASNLKTKQHDCARRERNKKQRIERREREREREERRAKRRERREESKKSVDTCSVVNGNISTTSLWLLKTAQNRGIMSSELTTSAREGC